MSLGSRLQDVISEKGISNYRIAKDLGINNTTVSNYLTDKISNPNTLILEKLCEYLSIDMDWLLTGKGDRDIIKKTENSQIINEPNAIWVDYGTFKLVPLISHRAQAGFLSGYGDDEYINELPKIPWEVDKEYKGQYLCFEVSGDSMESDTEPRDSIFHGDLLLCREVQKQHWKNRLHIHKWDFVIAHRTDGILCKRIIEHDTEKGILKLHSLNPYYKDYTVNMDDLVAIYNIVDVKRSRRR